MNSFMDNLRDIWISKRIIMIFMICLTLAGAYTGICPGDLKEKSTENHRFHWSSGSWALNPRPFRDFRDDCTKFIFIIPFTCKLVLYVAKSLIVNKPWNARLYSRQKTKLTLESLFKEFKIVFTVSYFVVTLYNIFW